MTADIETALDFAEPGLGRRTRAIVEGMGTAIVTGVHAPGELLPVEADLGVRYGASRSVLREAIKVLNAKGLVTARPRLGTSVTQPSQWNLFDPDVLRWTLRRNFSLPLLIEFTMVRLGIEPLAAAMAARRGSAEAHERIRAGFARMSAAHRGADDPLAADIAFHLAILDASGNSFYCRLKPLVSAALHFSIRYTDNIARDEEAKLAQHREVMEAILSRDADRSEQTARTLLLDAKALMEGGLDPVSTEGAAA